MLEIKSFLILVCLVLLGGCAVAHHMDEITTMADFARDKNVQYKMVDDINANYDALAAGINSGKIKDYSDQTAIRTNFGEPIAVKTVDGQEQWLYRQAIPQKAQDKIYLYFDQEGKLVKYNQEKIQWNCPFLF